MPTEPAAPADERAMIERLARFMGWTKSKHRRDVPAQYRTDAYLWWVEGGAPVANVAEWNPLTDANADVQVLQRAREVWDGPQIRRFGAELDRLAAAHDDVDAPGWADITTSMLYQTGDYARAVDAVLTTTERGHAEAV